MKYRKKPVVIEAIQWDGLNIKEMIAFVGESLEFDLNKAAWEGGESPMWANVRIKTLEGTIHASVGDYIIRGVQGEFYPCKPDIFEETYEEVGQ